MQLGEFVPEEGHTSTIELAKVCKHTHAHGHLEAAHYNASPSREWALIAAAVPAAGAEKRERGGAAFSLSLSLSRTLSSLVLAFSAAQISSRKQ